MFGTEGVASFSRKQRNPDEEISTDKLRFEQFIYDPIALEGATSAGINGRIFGALSLFTATVTATEVEPLKFPRVLWLCRALDASQKMLLNGAGSQEDGPGSVTKTIKSIVAAMHPKKDDKSPPENRFGVAFPRELLDVEPSDDALCQKDSLVTDLTGTHPLLIGTKAEEIVLRGPEKAMRRAPCAQYEKYTTYDRDEIERINSLRNLITNYIEGRHPRPLSIAVFGQPGSGKSFAIKQLAQTLFPEANNEVTFNLSQFESLQDLHNAFHQVRDMALSGNVPLIFWDEFDSTDLRWLKDFLAPMQDGEFSEHGRNHPVGRAIFVFAGGTAHSFAEFSATHEKNKDAKAPDFISRLRGYMDIKGPNKTSANDQQYVIRRALLLRNFLIKYTEKSVIGNDGVAVISPGVLKGLLYVKEYAHGARSMESVISQSQLINAFGLGPSELPPKELLDIHLSPDFMNLVNAGQLLSAPHGSFSDELAARIHEMWRKIKESADWRYGDVRDDDTKTNPYLLPYEQLAEEGRERNLGPARIAFARLESLGFQVVPHDNVDPAKHTVVKELSDIEMLGLARFEHQRWMREYLMKGYVYGKTSDDDLWQHYNIRKFEHLPAPITNLDMTQIQVMLEMLNERGMVLVRQINQQ
ncbi:MAG: RyR domain-containing protein [Pontiellaceae bacterium]|nr:RyR domain-containing protein [Pontiellaceae bacterium]